jgi:hypothetical protein
MVGLRCCLPGAVQCGTTCVPRWCCRARCLPSLPSSGLDTLCSTDAARVLLRSLVLSSGVTRPCSSIHCASTFLGWLPPAGAAATPDSGTHRMTDCNWLLLTPVAILPAADGCGCALAAAVVVHCSAMLLLAPWSSDVPAIPDHSMLPGSIVLLSRRGCCGCMPGSSPHRVRHDALPTQTGGHVSFSGWSRTHDT